MSSRRRKQQVREMSRIAAEKFNARIRAYKEIVDLIKSGSDEELAARIRQAVEEKSDLRFYGAFGGYSLLHTAAENDRAEAAAILVREAGFDVDILANFNRTPLHAAGIFCAAQAAKTLISLGAEVDARDEDGNTPLQRAACYAKETDDKNFETIKILLDAGANPHAKDIFHLEPVNWFETEQAQRRFLALIGEESEKLPPRFMFCNGELILADWYESLSNGEFEG